LKGEDCRLIGWHELPKVELCLLRKSDEKALRQRKGPAAHHGLSYLAFALGFIFPCAQRCFSSRDSFLRAAALN